MDRFCVCGRRVRIDQRLCRECAEVYGTDASEWPAWLLWQVNDIKREIYDESSKEDDSTFDEIESNGRGGYRAKPIFALRGCRTETHLYQDRDQHGGNGIIANHSE